MAKEVIMPKVDMDQETGTVVEWRKNNGEHVKTGDVILVIETDKVAVDVKSPGTGILKGIFCRPRRRGANWDSYSLSPLRRRGVTPRAKSHT